MLSALCTPGYEGIDTRPFRQRPVVPADKNDSLPPRPAAIDYVPVPTAVTELYESFDRDCEFYLGSRLVFFAPSYVVHRYTPGSSDVDVAVDTSSSPVRMWCFDSKRSVMTSRVYGTDERQTLSVEEFIEEYLR